MPHFENGSMIREWACRGLEIIGAELDYFENGVRHDEAVISKPSSRVKIMVIPTNEELMIARDTREIVLALARDHAAADHRTS